MLTEEQMRQGPAEKDRDAFILDKVERYLITLIQGTTNALAIDELTQALAHVRHSRRAIEKHGVDFYRGLGS